MKQLEQLAESKHRRILELYEQYREGNLEQDIFLREKMGVNLEEAKLQQKIKSLKEKIEEMKKELQAISLKGKVISTTEKVKMLGESKIKEIMFYFIDRVYVFDNQRIEIEWDFESEYKDLLAQLNIVSIDKAG